MPTNDGASETPKYLIGRVTKLTGLSVDVVRVWERRYGAVRPARSDGGTRLYSDADIRRLQRLRRAVDGGHSISQAARLSESELDELITDAQPSVEAADPHRAVRERFIEAVGTMDAVAADLELARAATLFPVREVVKQIIAPIINEIGERRAHREFGIAHERLASGLLRNLAGSLFRLCVPSGDSDTVVLASLSGDRRETEILLAAILAAAHSRRVVFLGAEVPAAEIALAVRLTGARTLYLSLIDAHNTANQELAAIAGLVPFSTQLWICNSGTSRHGDLIPRANCRVVHDLEALDVLLEEGS